MWGVNFLIGDLVMGKKPFRNILYASMFIVGIVALALTILPLIILLVISPIIICFIIACTIFAGLIFIIQLVLPYLEAIKNKNNAANLIYLILKKDNFNDKRKKIWQSVINISLYNLKHNFKKILFTTIISILFFSYFNEICQIVDKYWVRNIINYLDINNSIYIVLLISVILYYFRQFYLKKCFNGYKYLLMFILIFFHCFGIWDYSYKLFFPIYFISIIEIFYSLYFLYHYGQINVKSSIFAIDTPLKSNEDDKEDSLGREHLIKTSAENLSNSFFDKGAFYVAVTGEWGSGKTSFTNLLTEKMLNVEKDIIKIEINTWRTEDPNLFTKYFFDTLNKELSVYIPELSRLLPKYLAIIANSCDNKYLKGASKILDSFNNNNNDPYESIKKVLIKAKKKILVVIDDIDRLNAEEIYQILKLVRNTVDFPYMQFIMNFDKEYVVDCLGKFIGNNSNTFIDSKKEISKYFSKNKEYDFLEKFINLEIMLPSFEEIILSSQLDSLLENYDSKNNKFKLNISKRIIYLKNKDKYIVKHILQNTRGVYKFFNNFILIAKSTNTYINTPIINHNDLFLLELLKYRFNYIYEILRNSPLEILTLEKSNKIPKYKFIKYDPRFKQKSQRINKIINNSSLEKLLDSLFPEIDERIFENRIRDFDNYFNYFSYRESNEYFNLKEFNYILTNKDKFIEKFTKKIDEKISFLKKTKKYQEFDNEIHSLSNSLISLTISTINSYEDDNIFRKILSTLNKKLIELLRNSTCNDGRLTKYYKKILIDFFKSEFLVCELNTENRFNIYWECLKKIIINSSEYVKTESTSTKKDGDQDNKDCVKNDLKELIEQYIKNIETFVNEGTNVEEYIINTYKNNINNLCENLPENEFKNEFKEFAEKKLDNLNFAYN